MAVKVFPQDNIDSPSANIDITEGVPQQCKILGGHMFAALPAMKTYAD